MTHFVHLGQSGCRAVGDHANQYQRRRNRERVHVRAASFFSSRNTDNVCLFERCRNAKLISKQSRLCVHPPMPDTLDAHDQYHAANVALRWAQLSSIRGLSASHLPERWNRITDAVSASRRRNASVIQWLSPEVARAPDAAERSTTKHFPDRQPAEEPLSAKRNVRGRRGQRVELRGGNHVLGVSVGQQLRRLRAWHDTQPRWLPSSTPRRSTNLRFWRRRR